MIKWIHVSSVVLAFAFFLVRGVWMVRRSPRLQLRWVRIAPHVIDTVLLASAVVLAWRIGQYPFVHGWLTAKVLGLLAYVGLGTVALRRGHTPGIRIGAWIAALAVFVYVVSVAVTRTSLPLGSWALS